MDSKKIELLAPAKNAEFGIEAINVGADAVYIAAEKFGARRQASNPFSEIIKLIDYAHLYQAKVYLTLNTILYENELLDAEKLIHNAWNEGIDGIIFQDIALFQMNLPPVKLIASTQTHNIHLDKIKFFEQQGVQRIILGRELSLDQIKHIRDNSQIELECFVHGSLCVSYSGQCYISQHLFNRSGNRGECAQACRMKYSLVDNKNNVIIKDKYLLSLKDLNLSQQLSGMINAGVDSFKIEGRLKDIYYLKNITAFYREKIDALLNENLIRSSSGFHTIGFKPQPERTFHRPYTELNISGTLKNVASFDSPKSLGRKIGVVSHTEDQRIFFDHTVQLKNGDGLCFLNENGDLEGFLVNQCENNWILSHKTTKVKKGSIIYINQDTEFEKSIQTAKSKRLISVNVHISFSNNSIICNITDEDGISSSIHANCNSEASNSEEKMKQLFTTNFSKTGDTPFHIKELTVSDENIPFLKISQINQIRRDALQQHIEKRKAAYKREIFHRNKNNQISILDNNNYKLNISNSQAKEFYIQHGVDNPSDAIEMKGQQGVIDLMTCKYCILEEIGQCLQKQKNNFSLPLQLIGGTSKYRLAFDCKKCEMKIQNIL